MEMHKRLLCDANVLIDYMNASPALLFRLSEFYGGLYVPDVVFAEVGCIRDAEPAEYGIELLETPFEALETVAGLSLQDCCCLFYAQNGFCCVTNDVKLRKTCMLRDCTVIWGLELWWSIIDLVRCQSKKPLSWLYGYEERERIPDCEHLA